MPRRLGIRQRWGRIDLKVAAAAALAGVVALIWLAVGPAGSASESARASPVSRSASAPASSPSAPDMPPMRTRDADGSPTTDGSAAPMAAVPASVPASGPEPGPPAAWSLADARVAGDERAPPIQRAPQEAAAPAWQLDDHQAYARREQDRHQAVQKAFVDAADRELALLDRQIEQGRAMGLSAEQLAKGEEKRRRIAEMRARMQADLAASAPAP